MNFVHQIGFEIVARQLSAATEPYVFALASTDFADQRFRRLAGKDAALALSGRQRARANVRHYLWSVRTTTHGLGYLVRLAAHNRRINGGEERSHRKIL